MLAALFLAPLRVEVVEATNGQEALDCLASQPFDLVLLDVHMPIMDGRECIRKIRASTELWARVPVVALTADAMSGDREAFLTLGMTDYISKPVDRQKLLGAVTRYASRDVQHADAEPAVAGSPLGADADRDLADILATIDSAAA